MSTGVPSSSLPKLCFMIPPVASAALMAPLPAKAIKSPAARLAPNLRVIRMNLDLLVFVVRLENDRSSDSMRAARRIQPCRFVPSAASLAGSQAVGRGIGPAAGLARRRQRRSAEEQSAEEGPRVRS